jgi:hypothetical protein
VSITTQPARPFGEGIAYLILPVCGTRQNKNGVIFQPNLPKPYCLRFNKPYFQPDFPTKQFNKKTSVAT